MRRSLRDAIIIALIWLPLLGGVWSYAVGWEQPAAVLATVSTRVPDVWVLKHVTSTPTPHPLTPTAVLPAATFTSTPLFVSMPLPTQTPLPTAAVITVNGLPLSNFVIMDEAVVKNVQEVYQLGQGFGRDPHRVSRLGDSTIMKPQLLGQFDEGLYNLGNYDYLQPVIAYYSGSFATNGLATRVGLHSWNIFDPFWSDKGWCEPNETLIACEIRINQPSVLFIRLGSNDSGVPDSFEQSVRELIDFCLSQGVIPIIGTKADRFEGEDNINNEILRQIAADYHLPLWDFDIVAETLPNRGLDPKDNVHILPAYRPHDFTQEETFISGDAIQDLTALMALEAVWQLLPHE